MHLHQTQFTWTKIISITIGCLSCKITEDNKTQKQSSRTYSNIFDHFKVFSFSSIRSSELTYLKMTSATHPFQSKSFTASREPSSIQRELEIFQPSPAWHSLCPPFLPHLYLSGSSLSLTLTPPLTTPLIVQPIHSSLYVVTIIY